MTAMGGSLKLVVEFPKRAPIILESITDIDTLQTSDRYKGNSV